MPASAPASTSSHTQSRFLNPWTFLGALFLVVIAFLGSTFFLPLHHPFVEAVTRRVPLPVAFAGSTPVWSTVYWRQHDALFRFASSDPAMQEALQADLTAASMRIFDALAGRSEVERLARQYEVSVTEEEVQAFLEGLYAQSGGEEVFDAEIQERFGWTKAQFVEWEARNAVLSSNVNHVLAEDAEAQATIRFPLEQAREAILGGTPFGEAVVGLPGNIVTAPEGDLGLVLLSELPEGLQEVITPLELNVPSEVQSISDAFGVILISERVSSPEGEQVHLFLAVVPKKTLGQVVEERLAEKFRWEHTL